MNTLASLRWKILALFLLNLAVLGSVAVLFLRAQIRVNISSLAAGPTGDRLEAIAQPLAAEMHRVSKDQWAAALDAATAVWRARGVRAGLFTNDGRAFAGDISELPDEVKGILATMHQRRAPRLPPLKPGIALEQPVASAKPSTGTAPLQKFITAAGQPTDYWAGVLLGEMERPQAGVFPASFTLVFASRSLRGGGLFFDYVPWLWLAAGLVAVSLLLWVPFVHNMTGSLKLMTRAAENIAEGRFDAPRISGRRDEIGRLSRALRDMALRLQGFATGQKRFLGDTAHELLSPLARLELTLSILEQRIGDADRVYVNRGLDEVQQISTLVQDLLHFSKAGLQREVKLEPVHLKPLVEDIIRRESQDGLQLVTVIPETLSVLAQPDLLARALGNVLRNAIRYAAADGAIEIQAQTLSAQQVTLTIGDHGPGVPAEALSKLFDPFFRPDTARTREAGGTGLGLAIVKSCVEACGGRVSARNRKPSGLELDIVLNLA